MSYLIFVICLIIGVIVIKIIGGFVVKRLFAWAKRTKTTVDDFLVSGIKKYLLPILYFTVFLLCTKILVLGATTVKIINAAVLVFIIAIGAIFLSRIVVFLLDRYWQKKMKDSNNRIALKWISGVIKFLIWIIALILFLDNIGVRINSLVAGLGIGGLAFAFAAQVILEDVFCFFTIFFDRPFELGDFIIAGEHMGTVEHIGIKTTRLRALSGEQLVFSNTDLTGSRIRNYKTMEQRRVLFNIGLAYGTSAETLKAVPGIIKSIIESVEGTSFGRAHFFAYGAYSLNFEIAYYVLSSDYDKYMDIHQTVNLKIKEEFDKRDIKFALPAQILHLSSASALTSPEQKNF